MPHKKVYYFACFLFYFNLIKFVIVITAYFSSNRGKILHEFLLVSRINHIQIEVNRICGYRYLTRYAMLCTRKKQMREF